METEVLTVEISKSLSDRLRAMAAKMKSGNETYAHAQQSIVGTALTKFLDEMEAGDK